MSEWMEFCNIGNHKGTEKKEKRKKIGQNESFKTCGVFGKRGCTAGSSRATGVLLYITDAYAFVGCGVRSANNCPAADLFISGLFLGRKSVWSRRY